MKHSLSKFIVFTLLGLILGYFLHRATLVYETLDHLDVLERVNVSLSIVLSTIRQNPFEFKTTTYSLGAFLVGFFAMELLYLYLATNTKNFRSGEEHGSARFGTVSEAKKFWSKNPENDIIMSKTERLTLIEKKKSRYDRNKNTAVLGGSGSGKTFRFVTPNLLQAACSYIVVDPKDHLPEKTGKFFLDRGYQVKIFDLVNMTNSHGFNPFRYVDNENDLNRLLTTFFNNAFKNF